MRAECSVRRLLLDVALVPEREREQPPELAAAVLDARRRARRAAASRPPAGRSPGGGSVSAESVSRANGSSSPRSHAAAGIEKPRLRPCTISRGSERRDRLAQQHLLREPAHLVPRRQARTRSSSRPGRGTARAPRASAPSTRGRSSRAGRRRGRSPKSTSWRRASGRRRPRSRGSARGRRRPGRRRRCAR